jgi:hypothetical protein
MHLPLCPLGLLEDGDSCGGASISGASNGGTPFSAKPVLVLNSIMI